MTKHPRPTRSASPHDPILVTTAPAAFTALRAEIEAVPDEALPPTNLHVARAARRGLAVAERIEPLLPALGRLEGLDASLVAKLRAYALAVLHADELASEVGVPVPRLPALLEEAYPLRDVMLRGAELLAVVGLVSPERVAAIRSGQGHADTAGDVQALGRLYLELWDRVHDKTPVTRAMAERAISLSAELNEALGVRELGEDDPLSDPSDPGRLRSRAFWLFLRAYEECRRGVTFLRWHQGDAGAIVPSLYVRGPRRRPGAVTEGDAHDGSADAPVGTDAGHESEGPRPPVRGPSSLAGATEASAA